MLKRLALLVAFALLSTAIFSTLPDAPHKIYAQSGEPTALITSIFADLSHKLGKSLNRGNVDTWSWTQNAYPDASLGCPQPGQSYAAGSTSGYQVLIVLNGVTYDYRANKASSAFFRCSPSDSQAAPTVISTVIPTSIPAAVPTNAPIVLATALPVATIPPTAIAQTLMAYIAPDGNVHLLNRATNADSAVTSDGQLKTGIAGLQDEDTTSRRYYNLRWSPDGTTLLFNEFPANNLYTLKPGQKPTLITANSWVGAWSPDGTQIASMNDTQIEVLPAGGGAGRVVGSQQGACNQFYTQRTSGDGQVDLSELSYLSSIDQHIALDWIAGGFVHTDTCADHLQLTGTDKPVVWATKLGQAISSPDHAHGVVINAINNYALSIVDYGSGTIVPLLAIPQLVNVASWTSDGSAILYSTTNFTTSNSVKIAPNATAGQQLFPSSWTRISGNDHEIALWRVALADKKPVQILTHVGYTTSQIAALPDGTGIAFTVITSAADMIRAINSGAPVDQITALAPHAEILLYDEKTRVIHRLALGSQPTFGVTSSNSTAPTVPTLSVTAATAPPTPTALVLPALTLGSGTATDVPIATLPPVTPLAGSVIGVNCLGAPPSRLTVGSTAHVTAGDPNDLRSTPGGQSIAKIPGGAAFNVLAGPTCANGIAWWQVSYNGQVGWTAEGQGSTYYLEP